MIHESQWGVATSPAVDWNKLEVSDPAFESPGIRHITVKTDHLYGRADLTLALPPNLSQFNSKPLPIVVLLHGVYGSHWAWIYKGGAARTLNTLVTTGIIPPCILAMPSDGLWSDGTGYLRHQQRDFGAWVVRDVPAVVRKLYPASAGGPLCLSGLSMGGFGALWLGALYGTETVAAASGMSSVTSLRELWDFTSEPDSAWKLGDGRGLYLEEMLRLRHDALPALRFDCGSQDPLIDSNRSLSLALKREGIGHVFEESAGKHDWDYWKAQLPHTLRFFAEATEGS